MSAASGERGSAMLAAIGMMLVASFVVVAIMVSTDASRQVTRDRLEAGAAEQLARDAGVALAEAYSANRSGEHDGFLPSAGDLGPHATRVGGVVLANSAVAADVGPVDVSRVPARGQFTVRQPLDGQRQGYWQVFSVRLPTWGVTDGGRVAVYVRVWTGGRGGISRPAVYRLEFRPSWFADYQMLFDGKLAVGPGAILSGKVHSNGFENSFFDQYRWQAQQVRIDPAAGCTGSARITTAAGTISGPASCMAVARVDAGKRMNLLRGRDLATALRTICQGPAAERPSIQFSCPTTTGTIVATLAGSSVSLSSGGTLTATVTGNRPQDRQGAVVVAAGDVVIRGNLAPTARLTIITSAGGASFGTGGAPAIRVINGGTLGASTDVRSSFGAVAEGDVIFDERTACPVTARGAFMSMTGLLSIHPTWRIPIGTNGGTTCAGTARIEGSIVSHYAPLMAQPLNGAGYAVRQYVYRAALWDNPPPMYPTAGDWELTRMAPANLDCFNKTSFALLATGADCG